MSSLLNVAARGLMANQTVLQTVGNNISNVNTTGFSRQSAVLQTVQGQFTGSGYIGKGVEVSTIQRNYSEFLTRQATLASAVSAGDTTRSDQLKQLENLFPGGANALGAAVSDMLNAFSDVASAPTDLAARNVALAKVNETASRMSATSASLGDLQSGVSLEISQKLTAVNTLAANIAKSNAQIAQAQSSGQPPNDLLDQRDQFIRQLNQYVQTSSIAASDGSIGVFIGGGQPLVMGSSAATLTSVADNFGDTLTSKIAIVRNGASTTLDENTLGGGEIPSLVKFQNTDLTDARNQLGRYTLAITTAMNDQHKLGLDLDGNPGGNLFSPANLTTASNILSAKSNTGGGNLTLNLSNASKLAASDYQIDFATATTGSITRKSDGVTTGFTFTPGTAVPVTNGTFAFFDSATGLNDLPTLDGLSLGAVTSSTPAAGDSFLIKPFSTAANNISAEFSNPRSLAVASPVVGKMGSSNTGSLQLTALTARTNPPLVETAATPVVFTFTGPGSYTRSDEIPPNTTSFAYTSGQAIEGSVPATTPLSQWSLVLQGAPKAGDTFTVAGIKDAAHNNGADYKLNSGNASAMLNLRDVAMFDGAAVTDGYANMIAEIGVRAQSASNTSDASSSLATTLETDRTAVSGVNLDEEASKLLQFQQAYQASAKVIQIAQSIFDTLIQTISH